MNKMLSYFFNNKENKIKFLLYIFDAVVSILSILLIPNKFLSVLFVILILFINIFNAYKIAKEIIEKLFNYKAQIIYIISLFVLAIIPLFIGILIEKVDFWRLFLGNTIPNILGAFTVCSLIKQVSKYNYRDFVKNILKTDYLMNAIIKIFYYFCFFNSVSFYINKNWKIINIFNNIYLFVVILSGLILGSAFVYRIFIDDEAFDDSPKKVYPTSTLFCGAAFLISCAMPSFVVEVEISPILLIFNTITAFIVALALLGFSIRKGDRRSSEYPFSQFGIFTIIIFSNCCIYIVHNVENIGNILYQFITGGGILTAVILALAILNRRIKKKDNSEGDERY